VDQLPALNDEYVSRREVSDLAKTLDIQIQVPDAASDEAIQLAEVKAKEAVVLVLQQKGEMTVREAAAELGLTYEGYLELLAEAGLPASHDDTDPAVLDMLRQGMRQRGSLPL
jgi:DNA-binding protein H-NS